MDDEELKNTPNKEKVLDEMNDYISSTMSIPIIKLDSNGEIINNPKKEEKEEVKNDVHDFYADKEEIKEDVNDIYADKEEVKEDVNEEVFPTPSNEVEAVHDTPDPVIEPEYESSSVIEASPAMRVQNEQTIEPDDDQFNDSPTYEPTMDSMNVTEEAHANLEEPVIPTIKKKSKAPLLVGILLFLAAAGALGYFVVWPFIQNRFMSKPKNVFSVTVKQMAKDINSYIDKAPKANALYNINLKFDSTIPELKEYSGYTYGFKSGIDVDNKLLESGLYMKDANDNQYSMITYVKDGRNYLKFSSAEALIDLGEADVQIAEMFKEYEETLNNFSANNNDIQHMITKTADLFVDSIDEKKLSQEKTTITLRGSTVNVEKNSYVLDKDNLYRTMDFILEGLEKDEISKNFIEKDGKTTISATREQLKQQKEQVQEFQDIKINIYTTGRKKDVTGYDIEVGGKKVYSYYWDDKGFELQVYDLEVTYTVNAVTQEQKVEKYNLTVTGVKDGNKTNVTIKESNNEIATLVVNQWDEKGIDLTYAMKNEEGNVSGAFKLTIDEGEDFNRYDATYTLNSGSDKVGLELTIDADYKAKIANIDTTNAVQLSEAELDAMLSGFVGSFANTPVGKLFGTASGMYGEQTQAELNEYYANNPEANPFNEAYEIE